MKIKILFILLILILFFLFLYNYKNLNITITFDELEPINKHTPVFYKGYKIGHSTKIYPSKDFQETFVDVIIKENVNFPDNITAKIRVKEINEKKQEYIELVFPPKSSNIPLTNKSIIRGSKGISFSNYLDSKAESGDLEEIKENLNATIISAGETMEALIQLFNIASAMLSDVRPSIKASSENLEKISQNIENITEELYISTKPRRVRNSFENIENTTKNLETATYNLSNLMQHANNDTILLTDNAIKNLNSSFDGSGIAMKKINSILNEVQRIICGIKITLSQKFSGIRLLFGQALK